jgi:hypothetical protein
MRQRNDRVNRSEISLETSLNEHGVQPDQRDHPRHIAMLRVALLHARGSKDLCVVRNISSGGLSARVYQKLAGGEHVEVELRSGERLGGAVAWERDWEVGIVFPKLIDVDAVLASRWITESGRARNLPRISLSCRGRLKMGSRSYSVVLQDISQGGAKVQTQAPIVDRGDLILSLPDLPPVAGVVRWVGGNDVGISFNECIPFDGLARWVQVRRSANIVPIVPGLS